MSQTWFLTYNAPVCELVTSLKIPKFYENKTKINFTSRYYYTGLEFRTDSFTEFFFPTYTSGRGDDYKKYGQLKYGRSDGTYLDVTNNIIIESPEDKKTGNRWTFKNRGYQYLTFSDNEPPTGTLLKFLQTSGQLIEDTYVSGSRCQDIHLEDKDIWNQLQSAWEQDDYTTALSKLQDSSITDKKLSADKINFVTSELKRLQSQNDDVFKSGKIKVTDLDVPSPAPSAGEVYFTNLGSAEDYEEPTSSFIQIRQYTGTTGQVYTDLNPKTKAANTMISPSIAREKFNQQAISLDESMRLIGNAIISLRVLTVVVKDQQGNPIQGATVKGLAGNPVTNESGVASGLIKEYTLTIVPPYVDLQTKTVDVSSVTDISINVVLEKYAENTILRFTNSTSVQFSSQVKNIDVCCVGGGGGGSGGYGYPAGQSGGSSWSASAWKGKGGAGGNIVTSTGVEVVSDTAYTLTIGSGGAGSDPLVYSISNVQDVDKQLANTAGTGGTTSFRGVSATGGIGGSTTVGTSTNGGNGGSANATGTEFDDGSTYYSGGGANGGDPVISGGKIISGPVGGTPYGGYGGYTDTSGGAYSYVGVTGGNGRGYGGGGGGGNSYVWYYYGGNELKAMSNGGNGASGLVAIKLHYN